MIRIGIIGTENSHAMAFAKYFNLPDTVTGEVPFEDIRVTAVMGSEQSTAAIMEKTGVQTCCRTAEEMAQQVDAVMIVNQKGSVHYENAMPFVEKGMPIFVDKPFTSDVRQAEDLYAKMQAHGCKVMGGSGLKYVEGIEKTAQLVKQLREEGTFVSGAMNFIMIMESEHDGIFFYASHLVEMCMAAFGSDIKALQAVRNGGSMIVVMQYENDSVALHFNRDGLKYGTMLYTTKEYYCVDTEVDIFNIYDTYAHEAGLFAQMIHGEAEPLDEQALILPVKIVAAIDESLKTGKLVTL
ncbi:MAG: Gfo/Idh/MocA family oxidoreductase [Oscillospiraceae bacterium]|nr:Gfo/Idh/MocA family oxidoreductase [Oscillospiraceae bacterium]